MPGTLTTAAKRPRPWHRSHCGRYVAVRVPHLFQPAYDVWAADGSKVWRWSRWVYGERPLPETNESPGVVYSWSRHHHCRRSACVGFEVGFGDVRQDIPIEAFTGNTVLQGYSATFGCKPVVKTLEN